MDHPKKPSWLNLELGFLIAFALYGLSFIWQGRKLNPTSAFFPRWVAVLGLVFITTRMISSIYRHYRPREEELSPEDEIPVEVAMEEIKPGETGVVELPAKPTKWVYTLLWMILLFAGIEVLGFAASSFLFLMGACYFMGYRKIHVILLYSIIMTFTLVGSLSWFFHVPLPAGIAIKLIRGY